LSQIYDTNPPMKKVKYLQLKPKPDTVLANLPWTGRKRPYILLTYTDGSTSTIPIKHVDLRENPEMAFRVAQKVFEKVQTDLALQTFNIKQYAPGKSITFGKLHELFLGDLEESVESGRRRESSARNYRAVANTLLRLFGKDIRIEEFDKDLINRHFNKAQRDGMEPGTINIYKQTLSVMFTLAVAKQLIDTNPVKGVQRRTVDKKIKFMRPKQVVAMQEVLKDDLSWKLDSFEMSLLSGMRENEVLNVNYHNLEQHDIRGEKEWFLKVVAAKGKKFTWRWIPAGEIVPIIEKRRQWIESGEYLEYVASNHNIGRYKERAESGMVFFEVSNVMNFSNAFREARRKAGLPDELTFHSLRHTFAVNFLEEEKGDIYALSQILGHSSVKTTEVYLTATPKILRLRGHF